MGGFVAVSDLFSWWGQPLPYETGAYNNARLNERAVEVPIAQRWLSWQHGNGLEVGNVLAHYGVHGHSIVDRYEEAPGVRNIDVFDLKGTFNWIVAISTVEHVRWDEPGEREPRGSTKAIEHLRSLLRPSGKMLVTVPTGHNPPLDEDIAYGIAGVERECTLIRDGDGWVQTSSVTLLPYGVSTIWAESVWVGEFSALPA